MKRKLLFAATLLAGALGFNANAQKDVTADYIKNAGFETSPTFDGTSLGEKTVSNAQPVAGAKNPVEKAINVYEIEGWKNLEMGSEAVSDYQRVFTLPYGPTINIQADSKLGEQDVTAPAKPSGEEENSNVLFVQASWTPGFTLGIKQDAVLTKGVYKLTFDAYVQRNLANAASLCGVKIGDNATYAWPKELDKWTNNEIYFVVAENNTSVEISMGYVSARSVGAGSTAFLFVDNVKLYLVNENVPNVESISATDKIINPNASEGTTIASPWVGGGSNVKEASKINGGKGFDGEVGFFEPSDWNAGSWEATLSQKIVGLANGLYTLKAAVQSAPRVVTILTAGTSHSAVLPAIDDGRNGTGTIAADGSVVAAGQGVAGWNYGTVTALVTDGTLEIGVYSAASESQRWTNIDNFTLSYIPVSDLGIFSLDELKKALAEAKTEAENLLKNADYDNVVGEERTALAKANGSTPEAETAENYQDLIDELQVAISSFKGAKGAYDAFADAAAVEYEDNFPYASKEKYNAVINLQKGKPNSASEATENVQKIISAYRAYVESNAMAEGVAGKVDDYTNSIKNNTDPQNNNEWTNSKLNNVRSNEPYTDAEGNSSHSYFDGGDWNASSWTAYMYQTVNLPAGKYLLSVTARGAADVATYKMSVAEANAEVNLPHSGAEGGLFNKGWEDAYVVFELLADGKATIRIDAASSTQYTWFSVGRFRLVRLGDATVTAKITEAEFATYVAPVNVKFGDDVTAYIVTDVNNGYATLEEVTSAKAGTPVILHAEEGEYKLPVVTEAEDHDAENKLLVAGEGGVSTTDIYVLANVGTYGVGFYAIDESIAMLPAGKVYLNAPVIESKFIGFNFGGEATGINGVEAAPATENAVIYNLAGQRVQNPSAGIYIVNGKKVLVK